MIIGDRIIVIPGRRPCGRHHRGVEGDTHMLGLKLTLARLWTDENGISSVEYALLLAFIAAGIIVAAEELGNVVGNEMLDTASCIETGGAVC